MRSGSSSPAPKERAGQAGGETGEEAESLPYSSGRDRESRV